MCTLNKNNKIIQGDSTGDKLKMQNYLSRWLLLKVLMLFKMQGHAFIISPTNLINAAL